MKHVRPFRLPEGWISGDCKAVKNELSAWSESDVSAGQYALIPHAGWYFSGEMAFRALSRLKRDCELVILAGGHLYEDSAPLVYNEEAFETPCGTIYSDTGACHYLRDEFPRFEGAEQTDNSVEVHLPMLHFLFPRAGFCLLRLPPVNQSVKILDALTKWADSRSVSWIFAASSDLCHYGSRYSFTPAGKGLQAREWFFKKNREFIDLILEGQSEAVLSQGISGSACSSAGAAFLASKISGEGRDHPVLWQQTGSSLDKMESDSYVGYGSLVF